MKTIRIIIPDMQSMHCQARVNKAITATHGVKLNNIQPGSAEVSLPETITPADVISTIENAGYKVSLFEQQDAGESGENAVEQTFRFKTNINCSGCVAKVTPALNSIGGVSGWEVDTTQKDKVLTVRSERIIDGDILKSVQDAGFSIEPIIR